ncbi:hypothetical protein V3C99_005717, partial [Haemonchus contortus]
AILPRLLDDVFSELDDVFSQFYQIERIPPPPPRRRAGKGGLMGQLSAMTGPNWRSHWMYQNSSQMS